MTRYTPIDATGLSRKEWVEACHFHDLTDEEVLREVAERVSRLKAEKRGKSEGHPLVLLDLDSTLYEVQPRSLQILKEWLQTDEASEFPRVKEALTGQLSLAHIGYSLRDTFSSLGLSLDWADARSACDAAKRFWGERFFTDDYLKYDRPYPGAVEFTRKLYALGSEIVYLTGRDDPGMGEGTKKNLIRDGFPWDIDRTHLLMKPNTYLSDVEYKRGAADYIRKHGSLLASFENEPRNLVALYEVFPDAMHVFVDTVCSEHPAEACRGLYRIRGFM
jgi:phosphoglycolate phosphatase-like HAD superfamily hydrolase